MPAGARRLRRFALALLLAVVGSSTGLAQVVVEVSLLSCLKARQPPWTFGDQLIARASQPATGAATSASGAAEAPPSSQRVASGNDPAPTLATPEVVEAVATMVGAPLRQISKVLDPIVRAAQAGNIVLDDFDAIAPIGAVRPGTTWVGSVAQNAGSITVGGSARDDNGWGVTGRSINATDMNSLTVVAQREVGNATPSLFIQLEDLHLHTQVYSVNTSLFGVGVLTTVQIPLGAWSPDFAVAQITGWNIGGGGAGTVDFRMTFDSLAFSPIAVPEPATVALLAGLAVLGFAVRRCLRS